jgi:hypothetical protein
MWQTICQDSSRLALRECRIDPASCSGRRVAAKLIGAPKGGSKQLKLFDHFVGAGEQKCGIVIS